jgi:signal transduction histidine kinase
MKIKYQFCLLFFATIGLIASIANLTIYFYYKEILLKEKYEHLESISESRKIQVQDVIQNKIDIVNVLSRIIQFNSLVVSDTLVKAKETSFITVIKNHQEALKSVHDIFLLDRNGIVIEAYNNSQIGRQYIPKDTIYWKQDYWHPYKSQAPHIEGSFLTKKKKLILTISTHVFNQNIFIGTLVADIDASEITELIQNYTGLGHTGETILAKKNGTLKFIAPTRFKKDTLLTFPPSAINNNHPFYHALNYSEGIVENVKDYRGKTVLASVRFIEEAHWGMVTKMDQTEALLPVRKAKNLLLLINIIGALLILLFAYVAGIYFAKPINKLIESANRIKEGDLSKRIDVHSKNEIGTLANTFNEMAHRLDIKMHELKISNESLNKYAYVITHDLKSPVISISSLAQIIKEEYSNRVMNAEGQAILEMMILKTNHMKELIEGVLASAKGGVKPMEKEHIHTSHLLQNVIDNLNPSPHILITIKNRLPEVYFNKISLIQVFQNLLSNAIKFINKPVGIIEIGCIDTESKFKFYIKDNGQGIKEADFNKIFLMFESAQNKPNIESHGIGLSIVKKIITENGGEVWLESEVNKGTTFYFTIPKNHKK